MTDYCQPTGKVRYSDKRIAARARRALQSKRLPGTLNVYRCDECGGWHLGRARNGKVRP